MQLFLLPHMLLQVFHLEQQYQEQSLEENQHYILRLYKAQYDLFVFKSPWPK